MNLLGDAKDLDAACLQILAAAARGGPQVSVMMLAEALTQMRELSPALSGELWESCEAVLRAAGDRRPTATVVHITLASKRNSVGSASELT